MTSASCRPWTDPQGAARESIVVRYLLPMDDSKERHSGGGLCGAVCYEVRGRLQDARRLRSACQGRQGGLMLRQAQHEGDLSPRPEPVEGRGRLRSKVETRSSLPASQNNAGKSKTPAEAGVSCSAAEAPYFSFLLEYLAASSLKALPAVKRGCRVAGLALKVVGSPVKGLVPLRALVAAL